MVCLLCLCSFLQLFTNYTGLFSEVNMSVIEDLPLETLVVRICCHTDQCFLLILLVGHKYSATT